MKITEVIEHTCSDCQYNDRCLYPCDMFLEAMERMGFTDSNQYSLFDEDDCK